jgi:hypothetical protein
LALSWNFFSLRPSSTSFPWEGFTSGGATLGGFFFSGTGTTSCTNEDKTEIAHTYTVHTYIHTVHYLYDGRFKSSYLSWSGSTGSL